MTAKETCPVDDCRREVAYNGMCKRHATRMARHGDPLKFIPHVERNFPRGAANANWTGDAATYSGMHQRVGRALGRASEYPCHECGETAAHWSYDHADSDERQSEYGAYSLSIDHYVPRCVSCHKKLDLALKPQKPDTPIDLEAVQRLRAEGAGVKAVAELLGVHRRRVERALDELGLPRVTRKGRVPKPRCDQPMRPWRGAVSLCSRQQGHAGKHEARRRPKAYSRDDGTRRDYSQGSAAA